MPVHVFEYTTEDLEYLTIRLRDETVAGDISLSTKTLGDKVIVTLKSSTLANQSMELFTVSKGEVQKIRNAFLTWLDDCRDSMTEIKLPAMRGRASSRPVGGRSTVLMTIKDIMIAAIGAAIAIVVLSYLPSSEKVGDLCDGAACSLSSSSSSTAAPSGSMSAGDFLKRQ